MFFPRSVGTAEGGDTEYRKPHGKDDCKAGARTPSACRQPQVLSFSETVLYVTSGNISLVATRNGPKKGVLYG
jgi:hypothetical protein